MSKGLARLSECADNFVPFLFAYGLTSFGPNSAPMKINQDKQQTSVNQIVTMEQNIISFQLLMKLRFT